MNSTFPLMKTLVLAALLAFGNFFPLFQSHAQAPDRMERIVERLNEALNLSDEQLTQVKEIAKTTREQMIADRENMGGDRQAMMKTMRERTAKMFDQIEEILTDEQKEKYKEIKKEFLERSRERMRERQPR